MKRVGVVAIALLFVSSCKKDVPAPSDSAVSAVSAPSASVAAAPRKPAPPWYVGSWTGSYDAALNKLEAAPGALREWAKDEGKLAIGKGSLKFTVDEQGLLSGEADGPLGAQAVAGTADADSLRLTLSPKQEDTLQSFRGTAVVKRDGEVARGTLRAGSGDGVTLRLASLELKRATP